MQVKTIIRKHFIPTRMAITKKAYKTHVGGDMEKLELSQIADGTIKWIRLNF